MITNRYQMGVQDAQSLSKHTPHPFGHYNPQYSTHLGPKKTLQATALPIQTPSMQSPTTYHPLLHHTIIENGLVNLEPNLPSWTTLPIEESSDENEDEEGPLPTTSHKTTLKLNDKDPQDTHNMSSRSRPLNVHIPVKRKPFSPCNQAMPTYFMSPTETPSPKALPIPSQNTHPIGAHKGSTGTSLTPSKPSSISHTDAHISYLHPHTGALRKLLPPITEDSDMTEWKRVDKLLNTHVAPSMILSKYAPTHSLHGRRGSTQGRVHVLLRHNDFTRGSKGKHRAQQVWPETQWSNVGEFKERLDGMFGPGNITRGMSGAPKNIPKRAALDSTAIDAGRHDQETH
ncbi:hypothetical protein BC628DRAFT_1120505 [Trametes gibbosa]|nr:hypothetical protein BC628DRAFT_1120505 [Trametes gibbosa]